ncbi:IS110 family transposase [Salinibacter ruber]|uniref:IS110 family transposase n=1 Tax=Salinibacter ruber TaxID=146919 RepID=UPI0021689F38|nr:IS110 family transposase [Salinibacter ruber]MCS4055904.1 transposase [Salinibacter ruber]
MRFGIDDLFHLASVVMRYYVGIDSASKSFVVPIFAPPGEELSNVEPHEFSNDAEGFEFFQAWLTDKDEIAESKMLICVEQTGVYSEALCYDLHRAGFDLVLLDPHAVWKAFKDERKTDEADSQQIAEYGYRYRDRLDPWTPNDAVVEQVKTLLVAREQLVKQKTETQNTRQSLERKAVQSPSAIEALQNTADHLAEQIEAIEEAIERLIEQHPSKAQMTDLVETAPGAGDLIPAHMLVLTEGFTKESQYRKLASYLGICPNEHKSGKSRQKPTSRGYGPSMMRKLLHLAAWSVKEHNDRSAKYFRRKRKEEKPKQFVINSTATNFSAFSAG